MPYGAINGATNEDEKNTLDRAINNGSMNDTQHLRKRSIRISQLAAFVFAVGFTINITALYPYLREV